MTITELFHLVKVVALVQLGIMITSLFLFYLLRLLFKVNDRLLKKKIEKITQLLHALIDNQIELSPTVAKLLGKNLRELLGCMRKIEDDTPTLPGWVTLKPQLANQILKPQARQLASSSKWLKQYLAILCYEYGINVKDEKLLSKLVHSETFIVSLNAARVIFKYPTTTSINALINSLAQGRRIQQSLYAEILVSEHTETNKTLLTAFSNRLADEKDPYVKTFCYRILMLLPLSDTPLKSTETDILNDNLDLKIAAIHYLAQFKDASSRQTLRQFLTDNEPTVKAVVAKLIGENHDEDGISLLEEKLHDPAWWVRINAAEALSKLGKKGISVLKRQSPEVDHFAYETAQKVLITLGSDQ